MNRGLIVGKVYRPNGKGAGDAVVSIARIYGGSGLLGIQSIYRKSDSDGNFALPFLWSAADIFSKDTTFIFANIVAYTEVVTERGLTTYWTMTAHATTEVRCVFMRDAIGQLSMITNTFDSMPEIADSAISLATALKNWSGLVPFWKTNLLTTEGYLIVGAGNIYLQAY